MKAAQIIRDVANSGRVDASFSTMQEDQERLRFQEGKGAFMLNWPFVYPSAREAAEAGDPIAKKVFENMAWAPFPSVKKGEPAKVSIGGANMGIAATGAHQELATEAALCMTGPKWQAYKAINDGEPPVLDATFDDPEVRKLYPFADILRDTMNDAVVRPATPSYSDVTLAIQQAMHPPKEVDPQKSIDKLRDYLDTVADGGMY